MENAEMTIPYVAHESEVARLERINKRSFATVLILIFLLFASNGIWIWYESRYEDTVVTQDVDTGNGAAYVAGIGDIYGEGKADGQDQTS